MSLTDESLPEAHPCRRLAAGSRRRRSGHLAPTARRLGGLVVVFGIALGIALATAAVAERIARAGAHSLTTAPADRSLAGRARRLALGLWQWFTRKGSTIRMLGFRGSLGRLLTKAELGADLVRDHWFDRKHGTDTAQAVFLAGLDIRGENRRRGVAYSPTQANDFKKLMTILTFPSGSVFVDLGSGKGKTLLMAAEYGFKRVVGVEFSAELCEQATRNWSSYRTGRLPGPEVEVVNADVADYEIKADENVFYLFNPFDAVVMSAFLEHLEASLERHPRRVWIIYNNPVCRDIFDGQDRFLKIAGIVQRDTAIAVYLR